MTLKYKKIITVPTSQLQKCYPFIELSDKSIEHILNPDCYLYRSFKPEDKNMLLEESKESYLTLYGFDVSHVSLGATKICPWCHSKKTLVKDWAEHCIQKHPILKSADHLRQAFAVYKCQHALYGILKSKLKSNWKRIAVIQGGCHQCTDTEIMFDGTKNEVPKRCVRMDTPKSRMVDFSFFGIDPIKLMKKNKFNIGEILDLDKAWIKCQEDVVLGGILTWKISK